MAGSASHPRRDRRLAAGGSGGLTSATLRVGVIGLGVGRQHAEAYHAHPACEVTAICDHSKDTLAAVGSEHPLAVRSTSAEELLGDPDVDIVSIASYDGDHFAQTCQAIAAGKHVFVEKPLCLRESEARKLRTLLKRHPEVRLSSNLILRLSPRFVELKRLIGQGRLGRLFYTEGDYNYGRLEKLTDGWRGQVDDYSVVLGGAVHMVDLLTWLADDTVVEVSAYGNRIASGGSQFRYDDMVVGLLQFSSGMVAKVSANFGCVMPHFHGLALYGTKATFVNGLQSATLYESRDPSTAPTEITAAYPGINKGGLISSFVDSIVGDSPPGITADDVFRSMSVCFAMNQSARDGIPVPVKYI